MLHRMRDAVPRRLWLTVAASLAGMATMATGPCPAEAGVKPACGNIEECRELGERRFQEREKEKGPIVEIRKGFRYREAVVGVGPEIKQGDVVDITYEVRKTNGDYIYSLGRGRPDMGSNDLGETYRVRLGKQDVPRAVEYAMVGMQPGGVRAIQMPPRIGFETSEWRPEPTNFSGQRRMERFRNLLYGSANTKGYAAAIVFEVEVVRIRESSDSALQTSTLASATPAAAS